MAKAGTDKALAAFIAGRLTEQEYFECCLGTKRLRGRDLYRLHRPYSGWFDFPTYMWDRRLDGVVRGGR